ncbi:MAG: lipoprotein signal peptidase [Betaproteobacteria bacterium]|nr:lipoprotein signal peptidase [Betaproteobacteria bacterium]
MAGLDAFCRAALAALDQATKAIVAAAPALHARVEVTPWFNLVHVLNPGAAFSFLADASGWQRYFLSAIGLTVSAILLWMLWRGVKNRLEAVAYAGLIGGALGNVIDRLRLGAVVDYLDFYWQDWHWPAFNLADILVVGGAGLLIVAGVLPHTRSAANGCAPTTLLRTERRKSARP